MDLFKKKTPEFVKGDIGTLVDKSIALYLESPSEVNYNLIIDAYQAERGTPVKRMFVPRRIHNEIIGYIRCKDQESYATEYGIVEITIGDDEIIKLY